MESPLPGPRGRGKFRERDFVWVERDVQAMWQDLVTANQVQLTHEKRETVLMQVCELEANKNRHRTIQVP